MGLKLILARPGTASPLKIQPRRYARQAFFITLLNPKAIVFYMAFFPLFIDRTTHQGAPTFLAMALTIAMITAIYCLTLCACAHAVNKRLRANRHIGQFLRKAAGVFLIGFGIRLGTQ